MWLLVGLGNPGPEHAGQRHNVGRMAVEAIARRFGIDGWRRRFSSLCARGEVGGAACLLLLPETYMNESGRAVAAAVRFYKIPLERLLVFHDELDLAPGRVRVKRGGGLAGHRGLESVAAHLGSREFLRVRIGIGHPGQKERVVGHVLGHFTLEERRWLDPLLAAIAEALPWLLAGEESRFTNHLARIRLEAQERRGVESPKRDPI